MRDIVKAPCILEEYRGKNMKGPENADGHVETAPFMALRVRVTVDGSEPWLADLFPGVEHMAKAIAGEETHPGALLTSKARLPQQHLILRRADEQVVVDMHPARVANRPALNLDAEGEGTLLLVFVGTVDRETRAKLGDYVDGADLLLDTGTLQPDLFDPILENAEDEDEDDEGMGVRTIVRTAPEEGVPA